MRVERRDGGLVLTSDGPTLELPAVPEMPAMPPEVIVGVRPEHTHLWHDGSGLIGPIAGRAAYVEMLGRENFIGVETAGETHFTVHAEPDSHVREGEPVRFGLERGRLYIFDTQTHQVITRV
jgi:multiple sugar transport system ATP-binding protein